MLLSFLSRRSRTFALFISEVRDAFSLVRRFIIFFPAPDKFSGDFPSQFLFFFVHPGWKSLPPQTPTVLPFDCFFYFFLFGYYCDDVLFQPLSTKKPLFFSVSRHFLFPAPSSFPSQMLEIDACRAAPIPFQARKGVTSPRMA